MNPGPVEEVGKVTNTFMEIMRAQPLSLALVIMNIGLLVVFWLILTTVAENNKLREHELFEQQKHTSELLSRCVVPKAGPG